MTAEELKQSANKLTENGGRPNVLIVSEDLLSEICESEDLRKTILEIGIKDIYIASETNVKKFVLSQYRPLIERIADAPRILFLNQTEFVNFLDGRSALYMVNHYGFEIIHIERPFPEGTYLVEARI